jgi:GNAT superfamily N-acetyltransferase
VDDLSALAADVSQLSLLNDRLKRRDQDKGELFVASHRTGLAGHIYVWLEEAEEPELRDALPKVPLLMNLWVRQECRRHGVGTELITEAERWLGKRGYRQVALGVDPSNVDAVRLYLSLNYDPWPYRDIQTYGETFLPTGEKIRYPEYCSVLLKELDDANP